MTCCFTGHRYFPWKDNTEHPQHKALLAKLERSIDLALAKGAAHFICGNAIGVDTWAAELVLKKKRAYPQIFLEIALPFAGRAAKSRPCACCRNGKKQKIGLFRAKSIYGGSQRFIDRCVL